MALVLVNVGMAVFMHMLVTLIQLLRPSEPEAEVAVRPGVLMAMHAPSMPMRCDRRGHD